MSVPSQSDSEAAFLRLFNQNLEPIQAFIAALLPQAADAEEVFQQTSITLWRKFAECPDGDFLDWARGVAFNLVRNYRKVESRRPVFLLRDDVLESIAKTQQTTANQLATRYEALQTCLDKLPSFDRELIDRCYRAPDKLKIVAAERGWTANALYKRVQAIRRRLFDCVRRDMLSEQGA
jgi:RNA polymerase sigma-70 factor (ECF subfamily)